MIPLVDLKVQYQSIKEEIDAAVLKVLASAQFVLGEEVAAFEEEFAAYCGARFGVAVNSGTSALYLALLAAGVGPGDEVITVPFTFIATAAAVTYTGARPVFVDVEPRALTMDVNRVAAALSPRTKALLPVHLYGQPADLDPLREIAKDRGLILIEDAAQAHGSEYKGKRVGALGDLGCFSFYPGKNLGACGEGGIVVTDNPEYARRIRMLRDWGQEKKYYHELKGGNYRMEGIQGAVLRVKLRHLPAWTEARRAHAAQYNRLLGGSGVQIPEEMPYSRHVYHVYAIRHKNRDALHQALQTRGIQTALHYPLPLHLQKACADLGYKAGDFPVAEAASREVLSLPMYAELSEADLNEVCAAIRELA